MASPPVPALDERLILDHLADPTVAVDAAGRIVYANRAVERLLGWQAEELLGRPLTSLQPARLHDQHRAGFARYLRTRVPKLIGGAVRVPALRRDGTEVDVELTISPVRLPGGGDLFVGTLRDLSGRIELERQIDVTRYLRASAAAAARLNQVHDRDAILGTTVGILATDFDAAIARAWVYDPATNALRLLASAGAIAPHDRPGGGDLDVATSPYLVARVARGRRPMVLDAFADDHPFDADWARRQGIVAMAAYPLLFGDELRGVLAHFGRQPIRDEVVEALANFAAIVTGALNDVELLAREREARAAAEAAQRQTALLAAASRAFAEAGPDLSTVLETVARLVAEAIGDGCIIRLVTPDGAHFVPAGAYHPDPEALAYLWEILRATTHPVADGLVGQVVRSGEMLLIPSLPPDEMRARLKPEFRPFLDRYGIQSVLVGPLCGQNGLLGTIMTWRGAPGRPYLAADRAFLLELADRGALAIDNARLFQEQADSRDRIRRLAAERTAVLGQIADGVVITDPDGRIVFANDAARRLYGVHELGGGADDDRAAYRLLTVDGLPYPPDELPLARAVLRGETVVNAEWRIRRPDGTEVVAQGSAAPVVGGDGARLGSVLTARDVTDQRAFERRKDEFFLAAAHDLRSPLTSIKGWVQLLRRKTDGRAGGREGQAVAAIEAQATAMHRLVNQLLDTSRLQLGQPLALALADVDLLALTAGLVRNTSVLTDRHDLRVDGAAAVRGHWDKDRIEQIVANLLGNAVKYSPLGGRIDVGIVRVGDEAVLTVRDEGIGIPPAELPRVFDQFYRAANVAGENREIAGLGLGLFSARLLAERHGGRIDVASEEGRGSVFTLVLPLAGPPDRSTITTGTP
ncbi:MAG: hypothetical protein AVDCRST_MAG19-904 [uncultured Thermomicrobiales bacterium]|uniref:histidine kinase n=1 Tax=uncultured Thermomicrobiales bacterium TaxID=1645740 RepID=A0A6J4UIW6_9BACT|nr:MAG: hypothetical protein AVDCRST_MAG19-904 [uncultured Thermomicrobiales bacterium]